jgi:L-threonylcarbamoyladenylate synthase
MLHSVLPPSALPLSPLYAYLTTHHWPGPLTLLFPTNSSLIPSQTTASLPTVAIRFPSHPVARALIHHASVPLAAPSANSSGRPSPTRGEHVLHDLKGRVGLILDGGSCEVGLESTVVDGLEWDKTGDLKVLRPGGVTVEDLEEALRAVEKSEKREKKGRVLVYSKDFKDEKLVEAPTTPGMKYMHYTPSIPVYLLSPRSTSSSSSSSAALPTPISAIYDYLPQSPSPSSISSSSPLASSSPKPPSSSPTLSQRKVGLMLYTSSPLQTNIASSSSSPSSSSSSSISSFSSPNVIFHHHPLGSLSFPSEAANRLFDGLLQLERQGCEAIFIEEGDETGVGRAVAERVGKAIGGAKGRIEVSLEGERLESDAM